MIKSTNNTNNVNNINNTNNANNINNVHLETQNSFATMDKLEETSLSWTQQFSIFCLCMFILFLTVFLIAFMIVLIRVIYKGGSF